MATPKTPSPLSKQDKADLSRILKKARAFKAYYRATGKKAPK